MCIQSVRIPAVQLRRMCTCVIHFVVQPNSGGGKGVLGEGRMGGGGGGGGAEWGGEGKQSPYSSVHVCARPQLWHGFTSRHEALRGHGRYVL